MTLGFISALFFCVPLWQRLVLFFSTIPITVLMNSFRIGVIGVLVDRFGTAQAEGFLHDFEGWVVFMICFALLFAQMWLMLRWSGDERPLRSAFALEFPASPAADLPHARRRVPPQAWAAAAVLGLALLPALALPRRAQSAPERVEFREFPMQLNGWNGRRTPLEPVYVDALKFSDYLMADYGRADREGVNLYVAWYDSQRKGESAHSPKVCLPGGGWSVEKFDRHSVRGISVSGEPLAVNRVLIRHGADKELVYYWFQQRGRVITNEYSVKWYLFWDSLMRNRSDGSVVRLITPIPPGRSDAQADTVLEDFARAITPVLVRYIPG